MHPTTSTAYSIFLFQVLRHLTRATEHQPQIAISDTHK